MAQPLLAFDDAVGLLKSGGVLLMGTDTLPGFHCRADLADPVERILAVKGRQAGKSLLVLAGSVEQARRVTGTLDGRQSAFCRECWPGPFSLILPAGGELSANAIGGGVTVAVRVPAVASLRSLVLAVDFPLVSTSANLSGQSPFDNLPEAGKAFANQIDGIWQPVENKIDIAGAPRPIPSALLDLTVWPPAVLRAGPEDPPTVE